MASRTIITIPNSIDLSNSLRVTESLARQEPSDEFVLNFSGGTNVEPFGMLVVASEIRRLKDKYPASRLSAYNYHNMGYAAHVGFFRACGLEFGKAPGQAKGSPRYLPITTIECEAIQRSAAQKGTEIGDEVESECKHLAQMLCGEDKGPTLETLSYSLREMVRNVVEHSAAPHIWLCAQYWPTKAKVEVAIADLGIGLRQSLQRNPHLDASDDKRAVNYALMPAVSGTAFKGAPRRQKGPWANSGFGLYMTSRICRNGGNFFIASGKTGMLLTKRSEAKRYFSCNYQGTAIRMIIRTDQVSDLKDALDVYRKEGYAIQDRYKEIVNIDPSAASLMLSEDFDLSVWERLLARIKGSAKRR
jgi:hypothetical protein